MTHVLFWDIDGTLLTTGRAGVFALEQAARDVCGVEVDLQSMPTSGLTDSQIAARVIERCGQIASPERLGEFLRAYERHLPERLGWRQGRVLPGVEEILEDVARRSGVVSLLLTGNTQAGAAAKLSHYGLDGHLFDGGFCADTAAAAIIRYATAPSALCVKIAGANRITAADAAIAATRIRPFR